MLGSTQPRVPKMILGSLGISLLHKRNPWVPLACSIALPGLGHFCRGAYIRGFTLMTWEIIVNHMSRLNLAIYLTATGHLDEARTVVNYKWLVIYPVFYLLAMFDSYRLAVDLNNRCELEERQPVRHFEFMKISSYSVTFLGKRNPWMALFLAALLGGGGHFYNFQVIKAVMLMGWHLMIWMNAGLNQALIEMVRANWAMVHQVIDYQWLLFFPSMHVFNMWNAYTDAVEMNRLYEEEVAYHVRQVTGQEAPAAPTSGGVACDSDGF